MAENIGTLIATISADVSGLKKGLNTARKELGDYSKTAEKLAKDIGRDMLVSSNKMVGSVDKLNNYLRKNQLEMRKQQRLTREWSSSVNTLNSQLKMHTAEIAKMSSQMNRAAISTDKVVKSTRQAKPQVDGLTRSIGSLRKTVVGLTASYGAFISLREIAYATESIVQAGIKLDSTNRAYQAIFKSSEKAAQELAFVRKTAHDLGLEITALEDGYKGLAAASINTAVEGEKVRRLYQTMAGSAAVYGMTTEELKGSLRALTQIINKQVVSSEELRLQLSERLYGAMQITAEGFGLPLPKMLEFLRLGEITADQFIPRFEKALRHRLGPSLEDAGNRVEATFIRFRNSVTNLKRTLSAAGATDLLSSLAADTTAMLDKYQDSFVVIVKSITFSIRSVYEAYRLITGVVLENVGFIMNSLKALGMAAISSTKLIRDSILNLSQTIFNNIKAAITLVVDDLLRLLSLLKDSMVALFERDFEKFKVSTVSLAKGIKESFMFTADVIGDSFKKSFDDTIVTMQDFKAEADVIWRELWATPGLELKDNIEKYIKRIQKLYDQTWGERAKIKKDTPVDPFVPDPFEVEMMLNKSNDLFKHFMENLQDAFRDTFREMLDEGIRSWEDFGNKIVDVMKDTLAEIAAYYANKVIVTNVVAGFTGQAAGTGGGALGSMLFQGGGTLAGAGSVAGSYLTGSAPAVAGSGGGFAGAGYWTAGGGGVAVPAGASGGAAALGALGATGAVAAAAALIIAGIKNMWEGARSTKYLNISPSMAKYTPDTGFALTEDLEDLVGKQGEFQRIADGIQNYTEGVIDNANFQIYRVRELLDEELVSTFDKWLKHVKFDVGADWADPAWAISMGDSLYTELNNILNTITEDIIGGTEAWVKAFSGSEAVAGTDFGKMLMKQFELSGTTLESALDNIFLIFETLDAADKKLSGVNVSGLVNQIGDVKFAWGEILDVLKTSGALSSQIQGATMQMRQEIGSAVSQITVDGLKDVILGDTSIKDTFAKSMNDVLAGSAAQRIYDDFWSGINERLGDAYETRGIDGVIQSLQTFATNIDWATLQADIDKVRDSLNDLKTDAEKLEEALDAVADARSEYMDALQTEIATYEDQKAQLEETYLDRKDALVTRLQALIRKEEEANRADIKLVQERVRETEKAAKESEKIVEQFKSLTEDLADYRKELFTSSPAISFKQQAQVSRSNLLDAAGRLRSTDPEVLSAALKDIPGLSDKFLELSLRTTTDFRKYQDDFALVVRTLNQAEKVSEDYLTEGQRTVAALEKQVDQYNTGLEKMEGFESQYQDMLDQLTATADDTKSLKELQEEFNTAKIELDNFRYDEDIKFWQAELDRLEAIENNTGSLQSKMDGYVKALQDAQAAGSKAAADEFRNLFAATGFSATGNNVASPAPSTGLKFTQVGTFDPSTYTGPVQAVGVNNISNSNNETLTTLKSINIGTAQNGEELSKINSWNDQWYSEGLPTTTA